MRVPSVVKVQSGDVVDPADAALNDLLAHIAETSGDDEKREKIFDLMLTAPPMPEWPLEFLQAMYEVCSWVGLRHRLEHDAGECSQQ